MKPYALKEQVILLDAHGNDVGTAEKLAAHRAGLRHLALSVFIFDDVGRLLVQQRAAGKYHSALKWANSVCSHPRPGEDILSAAERRVGEELGAEADLRFWRTYAYRADVGSGLTEDELCHLFVGRLRSPLAPKPDEVADIAWLDRSALKDWRDGSERDALAPWFALYLKDLTDPLFDIGARA